MMKMLMIIIKIIIIMSCKQYNVGIDTILGLPQAIISSACFFLKNGYCSRFSVRPRNPALTEK